VALACILDHINVPTPLRVGTASLPSFHTLGIYLQLLVPLATLSSVSIYPPTSFLDPLATPVVPNSQNILDSVLKTKSNALVVVPAFLAQWAFSPSAIDVLKTLEYVVSFVIDAVTRNNSREYQCRPMLVVLSRLRWEMPW
jgi:hypothetical protein